MMPKLGDDCGKSYIWLIRPMRGWRGLPRRFCDAADCVRDASIIASLEGYQGRKTCAKLIVASEARLLSYDAYSNLSARFALQ